MDYSADFETTTDVNDCRVWAWACCPIDDPEDMVYGNSIDTFMELVRERMGTYYFHNLAFDGEFILNWLFANDFKFSTRKASNTFKTTISDNGKFYSMEVCFEKRRGKRSETAIFKDSLKKIPLSVENIAKSFKLPLSKLSIDYKAKREIGHELTEQERDYVRNDVSIVAQALSIQFGQGLDRLTIGSDALNHYKDSIGQKWNDMFPVLNIEMDAMIRKAYRGGFTYADPRFQADDEHPDRVQGAGQVFDVNSLYPWAMYFCPLPIGSPVYFHGQYEPHDSHPLYIQYLTCHCKIKPDHIPMLQIKHSPFYLETEYISETEGTVDLALTSVDLELLQEQYEVDVLSYNGGYMFRQGEGMFCEYIDYWMHVKETSTGGIRQLAKLMLNSLYGKFATNPVVTPKIPYLKEDGSVGYMTGEKDTRDPVYTPMGCFITAWARTKTIRAAQSVYDRFMYADTDSIHVLGLEPVDGIEVHPTKLGAWANETNFDKAKYVRQKTYIEHVTHKDGKAITVPYDDVKCAGMPADLKREVTFDNFKRGLKIHGKLIPKHVRGGIVLVETVFTLT